MHGHYDISYFHEVLRNVRWVKLRNLVDNNFKDVPTKRGVYIIRCNKVIRRAGGDDEYGILYIGSTEATNGLRSRIKRLYEVAIGKRIHGHSGGITYREFEFDRVFKLDELEVGWIEEEQLNKPSREVEKVLLRTYAYLYLDKPPLNLAVMRRHHEIHHRC